MSKAVFNWSGGKDSSLSLYYLLRAYRYDIRYLLTTVSTEFQRISMHGVRFDLLKQQAASIGIPLYPVMVPQMPSMAAYNQLMQKTLQQLKREGIRTSIFGDIFLEDLKKYREDQLAKVGLQATFPIWKKSTMTLVQEFIRLGFKAVVVCVNDTYLDRSFAGREIDAEFVRDLPLGVDPCGENGEFHSFVYDGPIFRWPVSFQKGGVVYRQYKTPRGQRGNYRNSQQGQDTGFWYCDLL